MQHSPPSTWRRSSHSGGNNNCVEVARLGAVVAVRDSKNPAARPVTMPASAWRMVLGQVRSGRFDL